MSDQSGKNLKLAARVLQVCLAAGICLLIWLCFTGKPPAATEISDPAPPVAAAEPAAASAPEKPPLSPLEQRWGIQLLGLSLTNNDTAVEVRYTVTAPEKILLLSETNASAYLLNQATSAKLPMITPPQSPTTAQGANLRTTRRMARLAGQFPPAPSRLIAGRVYSVQIPNWGSVLQSGSKVSLIVNDFRQDGLTVE